MNVRFLTVSAFVTALVAILLLHSEGVWDFFFLTARDPSPCDCLTGVFADTVIFGALRRNSSFIGIHWRVTVAHAASFMEMWQLKFGDRLVVHALRPPDAAENSTAAHELRRQLDEDAAHRGGRTAPGRGDNSRRGGSGGWVTRVGGQVASSRRRHHDYTRDAFSAKEPMCHLWILPERSRLSPAVWGAVGDLLREGTLAGAPVHISGESAASRRCQPLGVLLWADLSDRETLRRVVSPQVVEMFATISG